MSATLLPRGTYSFRMLGKTPSFVPWCALKTRSFVVIPSGDLRFFVDRIGVSILSISKEFLKSIRIHSVFVRQNISTLVYYMQGNCGGDYRRAINRLSKPSVRAI